jgi:hypothetical protein
VLPVAGLLLLVGMTGVVLAQPFTPSTPTVTITPLPNGNLETAIVWNYDMVNFPDTAFAVQFEFNGTESEVFPTEQLLRIIQDARFTRQGNQLRITFPSDSNSTRVIRVRIFAQNFQGLSPPSHFSDPFRIVPPGSPPGPQPPPPPPEPTGPPAMPVLGRPVVQGNTVTLAWTYTGPAVTGFEIIAEIEATGQILRLPVGPEARSFSQGNVPSGNFIVSMRALQGTSASPLSATFIVPVGVTLGTGDLSVTLTWNSAADMDLHVVEPNGTHVYYGSRQGTRARLDRDDTDGFGPENYFVDPGFGLQGNYRIYIVHFGRSVPTRSRIQVTLNAGTSRERTAVFYRNTTTANSGQSIEVAVADPEAETISERTLLGSAFLDGETPEESKLPQP